MPPRLTPLPWEQLIGVFTKDGFQVVREEGSHLVLTKQGSPRPLVIPKYRAVPVFVIRNNMRSAGTTREKFFSLLRE